MKKQSPRKSVFQNVSNGFSFLINEYCTALHILARASGLRTLIKCQFNN